MTLHASLDISMYPLMNDYCEPILAFIDALEQHPDLKIQRNALSTQVFGDYRVIMSMLTDEVEKVLNETPKTVFVLKLVGTDRSEAELKTCGHP